MTDADGRRLREQMDGRRRHPSRIPSCPNADSAVLHYNGFSQLQLFLLFRPPSPQKNDDIKEREIYRKKVHKSLFKTRFKKLLWDGHQTFMCQTLFSHKMGKIFSLSDLQNVLQTEV